MVRTSLTDSHPKLLKEWDYEKNQKEGLDPNKITPGSGKKAHWICKQGHQWETAIHHRIGKKATGCPFCSGYRVDSSNSLQALCPDLMEEWDYEKNQEKGLDPNKVKANSNKKAFWKCPEGHLWEALISSRANTTNTTNTRGCPYCSSLKTLRPDLLEEWDYEKNQEKGLDPNTLRLGSNRKAFWKCLEGHEWETAIANRAKKNNSTGCPYCAGNLVTTASSLKALYPDLLKEWDYEKNQEEGLYPDKVKPGTHKKAHWVCVKGHEWETAIYHRIGKRANGCPYCSGKRINSSNSLQALYPDLLKEWDYEKNQEEGLHPDKVAPRTHKKAHWICVKGHEWKAAIVNRSAKNNPRGCPYCAGKKADSFTSLQALRPDLLKEWDYEKNQKEGLYPDKITLGSDKKANWICVKKHRWKAAISSRSNKNINPGCPTCNRGWSRDALKRFVEDLKNVDLESLEPAERYVIFQQTGALESRQKKLVEELITEGNLPKDEKEEEELVEKVISKEIEGEDLNLEKEITNQLNEAELNNEQLDKEEKEDKETLPEVKIEKELERTQALEKIFAHADSEAADFLITSRCNRLWNEAFKEDQEELIVNKVKQLSGQGGQYWDKVTSKFFTDYNLVSQLEIPEGYNFHDDNHNILQPNLMQKLIAAQIKEYKKRGNWSGTGAGKTLSALLSSRVSDSQLTVITCPNNVISSWEKAIENAFPSCQVLSKTLDPAWRYSDNVPKYLIVNYEMLQQHNSSSLVEGLLNQNQIDMVIIDELHYVKQRNKDDLSKRKEVLQGMLSIAENKNKELQVLGLSATPVINNLQEGKSLIEMITGVSYNDLQTKPTAGNCVSMYQQLSNLGLRWKPNYSMELNEHHNEKDDVYVECSEETIEEIKALQKSPSPLQVEQILTKARLPKIIEILNKDKQKGLNRKTLLYTYYITGIGDYLAEELQKAGYKTGFFHGEDKSGLQKFKDNEIDVLIATSAIGTGVDGLQHICDNLIINAMPWTNAEYEQLKGRIYRQGQVSKQVDVYIIQTQAEIEGEEWSWCKTRLKRVRFKETLADAAVDGKLPEGVLRTPEQVTKDLLKWRERLSEGHLKEIERYKIEVPLPADSIRQVAQRLGIDYSDFSRMNNLWNRSLSSTTHESLQKDPKKWELYHTHYQTARENWDIVPYKRVIDWAIQRKERSFSIGDFGCGEALLAKEVSEWHQVHSFDHVAINDSVLACDMSQTGLDDESLDVAVFNLSLMGSNFSDYLKEANRTLKLDGELKIIEPLSRFSDAESARPGELFSKGLKELGFRNIEANVIGEKPQFLEISALKDTLSPPNIVVKM